MTKHLEQPQEIEVWYVLPAIRRRLVTELKLLGLNQKEIANKMSITPAAVSQYISGKRAKKNILGIEFNDEIKSAAKRIKQDSSKIMGEIQNILNHVRNSKKLCEIHKYHSRIEDNCTCCLGE